MGRMKEFLICKGCGESLTDLYYNDNCEESLSMIIKGDYVMYKCPYCGTINKSEPLEEG